MEDNKDVKNLNDEEVIIKSFKRYDEAEDGITKKVGDNLEIESFHAYESGDDDKN